MIAITVRYECQQHQGAKWYMIYAQSHFTAMFACCHHLIRLQNKPINTQRWLANNSTDFCLSLSLSSSLSRRRRTKTQMHTITNIKHWNAMSIHTQYRITLHDTYNNNANDDSSDDARWQSTAVTTTARLHCEWWCLLCVWCCEQTYTYKQANKHYSP